MKDWPEQARKAYQHALNNDASNEYLLRLNGKSLGLSDQKSLKRIIGKLDAIFCESHSQIEWPKNWDEEPITETVFRRWIMFFTSLACGVSLYCMDCKKQFTRDLADYKGTLLDAHDLAIQLARKIKLIKIKRNQLSGRRELPYYPGDLAPFGWFLGALESEQKAFGNPVEEKVSEAISLLRTTDRYDNGRYWPEPETVLMEIARILTLSHEAIKDGGYGFAPTERSGGISGLIKALVFDPNFNQWAATTNSPGGLPRMLLLESKFTSGDLARLIHIAQGSRLDEKSIHSTRKAIDKAKSEIKQ